MEQPEAQPKQFLRIAGAAVLFMLAPAVYWPAIHSGFIWDDNALLTGNALVQVPDGLRYIWFSTLPVDYFRGCNLIRVNG